MAGKSGTVKSVTKTAQTPPGYGAVVHFPALPGGPGTPPDPPPQADHDEVYVLEAEDFIALVALPNGSTIDTNGANNAPIGGYTVHKA
jgi:hypothetical protein